MLFMLDTDISSYIIKSYSENVDKRYAQILMSSDKSVCISAITASELIYWGEVKPSAKERVEKFLRRIKIESWDELAGRHYAAMRIELKKIGHVIHAHDMQIAAHARSVGATVVTNNDKHFGAVPGILIENWVEG